MKTKSLTGNPLLPGISIKKSTQSLGKPTIPVSFPKGFSTGPSGVPVIVKWKKNADQSVTGLIFNSNSFEDGETVTTFPISTQTDVVGGIVVRTASGARYGNNCVNLYFI